MQAKPNAFSLFWLHLKNIVKLGFWHDFQQGPNQWIQLLIENDFKALCFELANQIFFKENNDQSKLKSLSGPLPFILKKNLYLDLRILENQIVYVNSEVIHTNNQKDILHICLNKKKERKRKTVMQVIGAEGF